MKRQFLFLLISSFLLVGCFIIPHKTVTINSSPSGADVYADGKKIGKTPVPTNLIFKPKAAVHDITVQKEGYKKEIVLIRYAPKELTSYNVNLNYDYKKVLINTDPAGAKVIIAGKQQGTTPYSDSLTVDQINTKAFYAQLKLENYEDTSVSTEYTSENTHKYTFNITLKKRDTVTMKLISFEPITTNDQVKLKKLERTSLAYLDFSEKSANVKGCQRVTQNQEKENQIFEPVVSPIDDAIIYTIYTKDDASGKEVSEIWKQNIGTASKISIRNGQSLDLYPAFSPDGKDIYFSSNRTTSNSTIWRVKAEEAGGITKITSSQSEDFGVSFFPGGDLFTYTSKSANDNESQIWTINTTGTLATQLKGGESPKACPDTTKRILFLRTDKKNSYERNGEWVYPKQIWIMNIDGSNETQLTQNTSYNINDAQWSPDGKRIAYSSDEGQDLRGKHNYDIWIMKSDGTNKTQLTTNGSRDDSPCFSRDGKTIYFRSNRAGYWNIWSFGLKIE